MPKKLHTALAKAAKKKGLKGEQRDRYVYGGLANYKKSKQSK